MEEETIEKLLEALVEDYTWDELQDGKFMLVEMKTLLGMSQEESAALLYGAREIKKLRRYYVPDWKQLLTMH